MHVGSQPIEVRLRTNGDHVRAEFRGADPTPEMWYSRLAQDDHLYSRERSGHLPWQLRWALADLEPQGPVLEAGCGLAHFSVAMSHRGFEVVALDWSSELVEIVSARAPELKATTGDVRNFDFPKETFGLIYSPGVLEHFEGEVASLLANHARLLRPGGTMVLTMPYLNRRLRTSGESDPVFDELDFYQYAFSSEEVDQLLRAAGLLPIRHRTYGVLGELRNNHWPGLPLTGRVASGAARIIDAATPFQDLAHSGIWVAQKPEAPDR